MATQTYQSEAELENQLIMQLNEQNYASVGIKDYDALLANFREQFCKFNDSKLSGKSLSDKEWERLTNYMKANGLGFDTLQQYFPYYPDRIYRNMYEVGLLNGVVA